MQMREAMPLHRVQAVVCVSGCVNGIAERCGAENTKPTLPFGFAWVFWI
jgi:hypothetical protein